MNTKNEKFKDLQDIVEVKELNVIHEVNKHIKQGWKLLDTYTTNIGHQDQTINYCLGKPKSTQSRATPARKSVTSRPGNTKKFLYSL